MATIIQADVFIDFCKTGNKLLLKGGIDEEFIIPTPVTLENIIFPDSFPTIKNFNFDQGIEFIGCQFSGGIKILNCKGRSGIKFFNCSSSGFNKLDIKPALELQNFTFDHLSFENCNLPNGVYLLKGPERQDLNILSSLNLYNCSFDQGGFTIELTHIKSLLNAKNITESQKIHLNNIETNQGCLFKNVTSDEILFSGQNLKISGSIELDKINSRDLKFTDGNIDGSIKVLNAKISNSVLFENINISGSTLFIVEDQNAIFEKSKKIQLPKISLSSSMFNSGFFIIGNENIVKSLFIEFSPKLIGKMVFTSINIESVLITGTNSENDIIFRNVGFNKINIVDFFNQRSFMISNLNLQFTKNNDSIFYLNDSDLGSWQLTNFDFSAFKQINWQDSQIFGIKSSSVKWFKDKSLIIEGESDPKTCLRRRELYRQLKLASEKESDRISALEFKSRELKAYLNALKILGEKWWAIDRITLCLGLTNSHGQNWVLPLGLILAITTILFYPLIFMAGDPEIALWCLECDFINLKTFGIKFWHYGSFWPSLFNPARRLSDLFPGIDISFALGFWDGFQRILLAFFIFQIVSAFRKFVK
jgi:hypothetical protein